MCAADPPCSAQSNLPPQGRQHHRTSFTQLANRGNYYSFLLPTLSIYIYIFLNLLIHVSSDMLLKYLLKIHPMINNNSFHTIFFIILKKLGKLRYDLVSIYLKIYE